MFYLIKPAEFSGVYQDYFLFAPLRGANTREMSRRGILAAKRLELLNGAAERPSNTLRRPDVDSAY